MFDVHWFNALLMGIVGFAGGYWQANRMWQTRLFRMFQSGSLGYVAKEVVKATDTTSK